MIGLLALALAADAEVRSSNALDTARDAQDQAARNSSLDSAFVMVKDFDFTNKPVRQTLGFWDNLTVERKDYLNEKPTATYSVRRSDISRVTQHEDGAGKPFVMLHLAKYAQYRPDPSEGTLMVAYIVPGTIEEANKILNGVK